MFRQPRTLLATLLLVVAAAMFVAGWHVTAETRHFLAVAERTAGTVVAHEAYEREARTPRERFRVVVSFETAAGTRVRFRSVANYGRPPFPVGSEVTVLYDPADPVNARVDRQIEVLAPVVAWGAAVCLIAGLGLAVLVFGPRRPPRGAAR